VLTVEIVLRSEAKDAMSKIALPEDKHQAHSNSSQLDLRTEEAKRPLKLSAGEARDGQG